MITEHYVNGWSVSKKYLTIEEALGDEHRLSWLRWEKKGRVMFTERNGRRGRYHGAVRINRHGEVISRRRGRVIGAMQVCYIHNGVVISRLVQFITAYAEEAEKWRQWDAARQAQVSRERTITCRYCEGRSNRADPCGACGNTGVMHVDANDVGHSDEVKW